MATALNTNQRFARRAKCSHIWRDSLRCNRTQRKITRTEVTVGTQWHYIPANTNHTGLWEASVGSLKYLNGTVTKEVNIYQANIKTMYYDNSWVDADALPETIAKVDVKETETCNMTRWQHTQKLVSDLWRRWKNELSRISARPKCLKKEKDTGEYVFVNTANVQPGKWYFETMEKTDASDPKTSVRY